MMPASRADQPGLVINPGEGWAKFAICNAPDGKVKHWMPLHVWVKPADRRTYEGWGQCKCDPVYRVHPASLPAIGLHLRVRWPEPPDYYCVCSCVGGLVE